jgi:hypothetical protein
LPFLSLFLELHLWRFFESWLLRTPILPHLILFLFYFFLGLYWSAAPNKPFSISQNDRWELIDENSPIIFNLNETTTIIIKYHVSVEAYRNVNLALPLPKDSKDILQIRCLVNGVASRSSSSFTSTFLVEQRKTSTLSSIFTATIPAGENNVTIEWKKQGNNVQKWSSVSSLKNPYGAGYSLTVQTDYHQIWALEETSDKQLFDSKSWQNLTDVFSLVMTKQNNLKIEYATTLNPLMSTLFVKDRKQEFVSVRLVINGRPYVEGSLSHGASSWNPSPGTLASFIQIPLPKGPHTIQLQWRRIGDVFQGWTSSPSYLGGFSSSRNIIFTIENVKAQMVAGHKRLTVLGDDLWHTVGDNSRTFQLIKESAVSFTYSLPVSQKGNPNFDSNVWAQLSDVQARLVVDNVAYLYSSSSVSGSSRSLDTLFGSLSLTLPAGTHSIVLQWKSHDCNWMTLNQIEDGFLQSDQMLMMITSENSEPTITSTSSSFNGAEDTFLPITGLQVGDIDEKLVDGYVLTVNISASHGLIILPYVEKYTGRVLTSHSRQRYFYSLEYSVTTLNTLLNNLGYLPDQGWYGTDEITISVSDERMAGKKSKLSSISLTVHISPIDDPFSVVFPPELALFEGKSLHISPLDIIDTDSEDSYFNIQMTVYCGTLSLTLPPDSDAIALGVGQSFLNVTAPYRLWKDHLLSTFVYTSRSSCNANQHVDVLNCVVNNLDSPSQQIASLIRIHVEPVDNPPEIHFLEFPRWSIAGVRLVGSPDGSSAIVNYTQLSTGHSNSIDLTVDSEFVFSNENKVSSDQEITLFHTPSMTYALGLEFNRSNTLKLLSKRMIPVETTVAISLSSESNTNFTSSSCVLDGTEVSAPSISEDVVECLISTNVTGIHWLRLTGVQENGLLSHSNMIPLVSSPLPEIIDISPLCLIASANSKVEVVVNYPQSVEICLFNDLAVAAYVVDSSVRCFAHIQSGESRSALSIESNPSGDRE